MSFTAPLSLVLLVLLVPVWWLGWPRAAYRRGRDILSLLLRTLIMLCLVLALAGAQIAQSADRLAVMFLVDFSDSMGAANREAALNAVRDALKTMRPEDAAGVIVFGGDALLEQPVSNRRDLGALLSSPINSSTNLDGAIRLALGVLPSDAARRIVILSDGRATLGHAESAAELAAATGVEISYVAFTPPDAPEVWVTDFTAPSTINADQDFDLTISIEAQQATPALVTVFAAGQIVKQQQVNLAAGSNRFTLPMQGGGAGFQDFQVQVSPTGEDGFYQNNQLAAFTRVVGPPRVLVVYVQPDDALYITPALRGAGLQVDARSLEQMPSSLVALSGYQAVVLANVPATQLSPSRMQALQQYVRDLGGGLVVSGGTNSFGPGGYFHTPLEEALPLESQIKDQQRLPQLTIAYVIDRSGSMGMVGPSGVENLELAKEAIIRSIDFLQATDRAGVVSFDSEGYWIAHIQDVFDRLALQRLVATLRTGGGTDILAGMNLVADEILADPSQRKHIILLTDGGANPDGLIELATKLKNEADVTTSVIAIGAGAAPFLEQMAQVGGGNYHPVISAEQIPTIFTMETVLATRSYIIEDSFVPLLSATSPIMNGISTAPSLLGYVATTGKQTAEVILRGPGPYFDPILAAWQYGLGRSVAFTSDAAGRWGKNWLQWDNFARFWSQAVRWTITEGTQNTLETRVLMDGGQARLLVDARTPDGAFLNGLDLGLSLVNPAGEPSLLALQQVAPGQYEATFTPTDEGAYLLNISGSGQGTTVNQTAGWVMGYSSEYALDATVNGADALADLAALTGGRSLAGEPAAVFAHTLPPVDAPQPIWEWLLLAAALLLPFDVAARRLVIARSDWARLRAWAFPERPTQESSAQVSALLNVKRGKPSPLAPLPQGEGEAIQPPRPLVGAEYIPPAISPAAATPPVTPTAPPVEPPPTPTLEKPAPHSKRSDGETIASELLKRRKQG